MAFLKTFVKKEKLETRLVGSQLKAWGHIQRPCHDRISGINEQNSTVAWGVGAGEEERKKGL